LERIGLVYKEINDSIAANVLLETQLKARLIKSLEFTSIFVAINNHQKRMFLISITKILVREEVEKFPTWNGIQVYQKKMFNPITNQEEWFLVFEQKEIVSVEIFEYLVGDIINYLLDSTSISKLITKLKRVLFKWQSFFTKINSKEITEQQQQGLFGELLFLFQAIKYTNQPRKVISSWFGSEKERIDFQFENIGIEIKTSSTGKPYKITISAEEQLEINNINLYLYCIMVEKSNRTGVTILDLIQDIKMLLNDYPELLIVFNQKLFLSGIIETQLKEEILKKFIVKDSFYYSVVDDFPRITRDIIPEGVLNVKYQLSLDSCQSFQIEEETVLYKVKDVIQ
jgi:hypothetical protein